MRKNIWGFAKAVASEGISMITPERDLDQEVPGAADRGGVADRPGGNNVDPAVDARQDNATGQLAATPTQQQAVQDSSVADSQEISRTHATATPLSGAQTPTTPNVSTNPAAGAARSMPSGLPPLRGPLPTTGSQNELSSSTGGGVGGGIGGNETPRHQRTSSRQSDPGSVQSSQNVLRGSGSGRPFPGRYGGGDMPAGGTPTGRQSPGTPRTEVASLQSQLSAAMLRSQQLEQQVQVLTKENSDIKLKTQRYAEDVKKAHEQTVAYYTGIQKKADADHATEVAAIRRLHEEEQEQANQSLALMLKEANQRIIEVSQERDQIKKTAEEKILLAATTTEQMQQQASPEAPSPPVSESKEYQNLKQEYDRVQVEVASLQSSLTATKSQLSDAIASTAQAVEEAVKVSQAGHAEELQRLQAQLGAKDQELSSQGASAQELIRAQEEKIQARLAAETQNHIQRLQAEHEQKVAAIRQEEQFAAAEAAKKSAENFRREIEEKERKLSLCDSELSELRDGMAKRKQTFQQEIDALQDQLRSAQQQRQVEEEKVATLRQELLTTQQTGAVVEASTKTDAVEKTDSEVDWDDFEAQQCGEEQPTNSKASAPSPSSPPQGVAPTIPSGPSQAAYEALESEVTRAKAKIATLSVEVEAAESKVTEIRQTSAQNLEVQISNLRASFAEDQQKTNSQWQDRLNELEALRNQEAEAKKMAEARLNDAQKQINSLAESATQQQQQLEGLRAETVAMKSASEQSNQSQVCEVQRLQQEISRLNQHIAEKDNSMGTLTSQVNQLTAAQQQSTEGYKTLEEALNKALQSKAYAEEAKTTLEADLNSTRTQLSQVMDRTRQLESMAESEKSGKATQEAVAQHTEATIKALTTTNNDLKDEMNRLRTVDTEILTQCASALYGGAILLSQQYAQPKTATEGVKIVIEEAKRVTTALKESEKVRGQWEQTYEKAKEVNASANIDLQEARKMLSEAREELSLKELSLSKASQQSSRDSGRVHEMEVLLAQTKRQVDTLTEENSHLEHQLREKETAALNAQTHGQEYEANLNSLTVELQEKEQELLTSQQAIENLQQVLERFKQQKEEDVADRTQYLNHEIEALKAQLAAENAAKAARADKIEGIQQQFQKEIAQKNLTIRGLQNRLGELRKAIEEAAEKLDEDNKIDKRIVSSLLVNYIHSSVSQRDDLDDQVRVMSGLLSWDDEMMEKAGLIPGPQNPKIPGAVAPVITGGIVGAALSFWGGGETKSRGAQNTRAEPKPVKPPRKNNPEDLDASTTSDNGDDNRKKDGSLAHMWVSFLMEASQDRPNSNLDDSTAEQSATAAAPPAPIPPAPTTAAPPTLNAPPPPHAAATNPSGGPSTLVGGIPPAGVPLSSPAAMAPPSAFKPPPPA